ncbi:MAG TPA: hypothetical protein VFC19_49120 [Candidatus Limnocylindrales bacterium]|nr:hypothetical protein [Candidatus Limnocylindrales bacterium]
MRSDIAYDWAWQHANRNPDGSVVEESLVTLLAQAIDFDEAKERRGHAQRIVARRKRPGQTAPEGAIVFPGLELYAYEPDRLLADEHGNLIENRRARIKFKAAEAKRSQQDAQKAAARAARDQLEVGHLATWADDQYAAGRNPAEITWDTCVRETGLWKDADVEPGPDAEEEDPAP